MSATCFVLVLGSLLSLPLPVAAASCPAGGRTGREPAESTSPVKALPVDLSLESGEREFRYPEPITLRVSLRGPAPISEAKVSGVVTSPSGRVFSISFTDHVLPGWTMPAGGIYLGAFPGIDEDGRYAVIIRADDNDGKARFVQPFTSDVPAGEQRQPLPAATVGRFRVEIETSVHAVGYAGEPAPAPLRITTLYAQVDSKRCVRLSWQVPLNLGGSGGYAIRYAPHSLTSEDAWARATTAAIGRYTASAGETQTHVLCDLGRGSFYLAVKSTNHDGAVSVVSNDYHVVLE